MRYFLLALVFLSACSLAVQAADDERIARLIRQLGSDDFDAREQASLELIALGEAALPRLREAGKSRDPEVVRRAAQCVAGIEKNQKVAALLKSLESHPNSDRRARSAIELRELSPHGPGVVRAFIKALDDPEPNVRCVAASVLSLMEPGPKQAIPRMLEILKDPNEPEDVRYAMMRSLARIGHCQEEATPVLLDLLEGANRKLRGTAVSALGEIGATHEKVLPALLKALRDVDPGIQAGAASSLGMLKREPEKCVPLLVQALRTVPAPAVSDQERMLRRALFRSLGRFGDKGSPGVPLIIQWLEETQRGNARDIGLTWTAIEALEEIGPAARAAVPILTKLTEEPVFKSRACIALFKISGKRP